LDRLFLDANVLFSAAYRPHAGIGALWKMQGVSLVTSAYAVREARANLEERGRLSRLDRLLRKVEVFPQTADRSLSEGIDLDESDRPILLAAVSVGATHLLTGDRKHFGRYFRRDILGVRVLTPGDYLSGSRSRIGD
jgi:predicted nucleic acid-binding protein